MDGRLEHRWLGERVDVARRWDETRCVTGGAETKKCDQRAPEPRWCPAGLTKTQRRRLQKLRKEELEREKVEEARDE
jgi:hypothetical protein